MSSFLSEKILIVNGDDFGLNTWVNLGILDAYNSGLLRSASIFVSAPATDHAVNLASSLNSLEIGIHVNLSEGICTSDPKRLPTLVDTHGHFVLDKLHPSQFKGFLKEKIAFQPAIIDEMKLEIQTQITLFKTFGFKLSHLNFHHYLNLFNIDIFKIYLELAEEHEVPFRGIANPMIDKLGQSEQTIRQMKMMCMEAKVPCPSSSISNLAEFNSNSNINYPSEMTQMIGDLISINPSNSIEIILHPVRESTDNSTKDSYYSVRNQENSLFIDLAFRNKLDDMGFNFSGYSSLVKQFQQNGQ